MTNCKVFLSSSVLFKVLLKAVSCVLKLQQPGLCMGLFSRTKPMQAQDFMVIDSFSWWFSSTVLRVSVHTHTGASFLGILWN